MQTVMIIHQEILYLVLNADINNFKYSRYGIGFDMKGTFGFPASGFSRNVIIIFGVDMISSAHTDNKKKDQMIQH